MKKTLLASAVLLAFASNAWSATTPTYNKGENNFDTDIVFENTDVDDVIYLKDDDKNFTLNAGKNDLTIIGTSETKPNGMAGIFTKGKNVTTTVTAKTLTIEMKDGVGLWATRGDLIQDEYGKIVVNADLTRIKNAQTGLAALSHGVIELNSDVEINAVDVISTRGDSKISMGKNGETVKLDGDISFGLSSGGGGISTANSIVDIELNGPDSYWNGSAYVYYSIKEDHKNLGYQEQIKNDSLLKIKDFNLTLNGGASWTPALMAKEDLSSKLEEGSLGADSRVAINTVSFGEGGGFINLNKGVEADIEELSGSGTVNIATEDGKTTAALNVDSGNASLDVNIMNADLTEELTADDITADQAKEILSKVGGTDAEGNQTVATTTDVKEGNYNDAINIDAKGNVSTVTNSIMSNTLDLASSAPLAMNRLLMNDVRKRMGDLRAAEGTHGVWARYDGGKLAGERGLENDFTTVQVGIDTVPVVDAPRFGVAFAYTKSDTDMLRGSADMDAFSLAFYGTKFYDNGMFVDVIGRMATADTDVMVEGQKGTMDNVALSLSGELGWRFDVTDKFYFEPQAELTYTYVNADKLALGDSSYAFDSVDSLMARVGFAAGFKCPSNFGDVYVRASAVHEFLGDSAVTGGNGTIHEVDGEDTWVEFGIGANFNINKNTYVYADIERTEGAKLEEDWRANVGVRFAF